MMTDDAATSSSKQTLQSDLGDRFLHVIRFDFVVWSVNEAPVCPVKQDFQGLVLDPVVVKNRFDPIHFGAILSCLSKYVEQANKHKRLEST
ncbi:hypothetical protein V6N12_021724 [Hibiscus sabdariffa]|uniref:Uncharacterized protein n=1 Tax=Hibiscus sabdariffa TaxID=183260 RepID=A0ABR2FTA5_9ROSI